MPVTNYDTVNGEIIAEYTNGVQLNYLKDALGSVTAWVDQSCTIVASARYKPYGDILVSSGSLGRFTWVGTLGYRTTGLSVANYYVRARLYAAQQGFWNTVDPLWPRERAYDYAPANPVSNTDQSGLFSWICNRRNTPNFCKWVWDNMYHHDDPRLGRFAECLDNASGRCNTPNAIGTADPGTGFRIIRDNMGAPNIELILDGNGGNCNGRCAWTDIRARPPRIHICPDGYAQNNCPVPYCLILHEILHAPGVWHDQVNNDLFKCLNQFGCPETGYRDITK